MYITPQAVSPDGNNRITIGVEGIGYRLVPASSTAVFPVTSPITAVFDRHDNPSRNLPVPDGSTWVPGVEFGEIAFKNLPSGSLWWIVVIEGEAERIDASAWQPGLASVVGGWRLIASGNLNATYPQGTRNQIAGPFDLTGYREVQLEMTLTADPGQVGALGIVPIETDDVTVQGADGGQSAGRDAAYVANINSGQAHQFVRAFISPDAGSANGSSVITGHQVYGGRPPRKGLVAAFASGGSFSTLFQGSWKFWGINP